MDMLQLLNEQCRLLHIYVDGGQKRDIVTVHNYESRGEKGAGTVEEPPHILEKNRSLCREDDWSNVDEESDYIPSENEESDDSLGDLDLASEDEEYVQARVNIRNSKNSHNAALFSLIGDYISRDYEPWTEPEVGENLSEYENSDGDVNSSETDEDVDAIRVRKEKVIYDPKCDHQKLDIVVGMYFQDGLQCREALTTWAIERGKFIRFRRVSKTQLEAKCSPPCPWRVYASKVAGDGTFRIKVYGGDYTCPRDMDNKLLSSKWIATRYLNVFRFRPHFNVKDLRADILERFKTLVSRDRLYKAKAIAANLLRGSVEEHYASIGRYIAELRNVDSEGRFELLLGSSNAFKGLYIGFSSLMKGFKASCRPLIGLDGCFLKTYLGGVLLCGTGKDGNNQMFPMAWAVVEIENEECWTWFLKCLLKELGSVDGYGWAFISDQQKGLQNAVMNLAPRSEHRNCARHVYMNWRKKHKGTPLRNLFRKTVRSSYLEEYNAALQEMKAESQTAYQDFIARDTNKFCKAFISTSPCSDMIDNNISETFNGYILNARGKHVIHMCEEIRIALMVRVVSKKNLMSKVHDRICPNIRKELEKLRYYSRYCNPHPASTTKFEIHVDADKFVVDIGNRSCTCKMWNLTGIPCIHAISAIQFLNRDPADYVHEYYTVRKYFEGLQFEMEPMRGESMWPQVEGFIVKPPRIRKMPGRPKKKRRRATEEKDSKRLTRHGMVMTCRTCQQQGHNSRSCKNVPVEKLPKEKGKRGRPARPKAQPRGVPGQRRHASS